MANRKDSRLTGINPLAYLGVEPESPVLFFSAQREPTTHDNAGYNVGTTWLDRSGGTNGTLWMLIQKDAGIGTWKELGAGEGAETITGDSGIVVVPDALNNVDILGGANVATVGTANTLTINMDPDTIADSYVTDSGTATPSSGVLNVLGGANLDTSGAGNTVTIDVNADTIADAFTTDAGTAYPSAGDLNILGGTGISTAGAGNTVTITSTVINQIDTDSGSATPVLGVLKVLGGLNMNTAAVGDTVTIATDDPGEGVVSSSALGVFSASKGDDGEVLIGATGSSPMWATLTGGTGITINNAANSIEVVSSGIAPTSVSNFKVYLQADKPNVTGDGTTYQLPFDGEWLDIGNDFDTSTGKFTAPKKGIYCFVGVILCEDLLLGHDKAETRILITGTYSQTNSQNNINPVPIVDNRGQYSFLLSTTTLMDVGDTAEVDITIEGGGKNVEVVSNFASGSGQDTRTWWGGFLLAEIT